MYSLLPLLLSLPLASAFWQPESGTRWQIVLSQPLTVNSNPVVPDVPVYDIDMFINSAETIGKLHEQGKKVICYFSAGTFEPYVPDAADFNPEDMGDILDDWPDERWLNVGSSNVRDIMVKRIVIAKEKGCDAIDPDNMDGYEADGGGIGLKKKDSIDYFKFLATEAAKLDLSIGLKNSIGMIDDVLPSAQFAVNEQCSEWDECGDYSPFVDAKKPVFHIEYPNESSSRASGRSSGLTCDGEGLSTVLKNMDLDGWVQYCDGYGTITS
ncbi:hypothetical protein P152DRAFT_511036 [Eremomyces bilateralis CBS 781.70]|uniref:alpha-galactosidase n=1 Tax=Eremomyces bilateralis CBS 781.70 TaxID=1392243 RepID=A0A6G1GDN8_9PEZI|nr:uncharacterized protein P152DRAFT_511036 [Eremomyces bilateralis CBS 781.70]KAF1816225.1 hypothetical protein P152DRAFT_511036 [Eremomyces bilateralis CBS 781.70]